MENVNENNMVLIAAMQKFYSSLRELNKLKQFDPFDSTAILDTYFQEYRNVTFVIQKCINKRDKEIYERLRDECLITSNSNILVNIRNRVTKMGPINYTYKVTLFHYIFNECKSSVYIFNKDDFNEQIVNKIIREEFNDYSRGVQHFTLELDLYYEEIKLLDLIVVANIAMLKFIKKLAIELQVDLNSVLLKDLLEKCENCISNLNTDLQFAYTLHYELNNDNIKLIAHGATKVGEIDDALPYLYNSPVLKYAFNQKELSVKKLFRLFIQMFKLTYEQQNNNLMPTFLIVYSDYTFEFQDVISESKAPIKHKLQTIKSLIKERNIILILSVIEVYIHKPLLVKPIQDYITEENLLFNCITKTNIMEYSLGDSDCITVVKSKQNHILKELLCEQNHLKEIEIEFELRK